MTFGFDMLFPVPRNAEEATKLLRDFKGITGNPVVLPPVVYDRLKDMGVDMTDAKRNEMLPVDGTVNNG